MPIQFSAETKAQAVEFYKNGVDIDIICSAIQCSPTTLAKWRKAAGVKPRMSWRQYGGMERSEEN